MTAAPVFSTSLPAPLTEFIGRDRELREVTRLVADARLLTLTGAGGSGKTRLALAAASVIAAGRAGTAVVWVELASLSDPASLAADIAAVVGARAEGSESPEQAIVAALVERDVLLVLDNCEHLVEACAVLVEQLLHSSPKLRVLATSREPLGVSGERSWLVPPLALPDAGATADDAFATAAVQLFVERARDVQPAFVLTEGNAAAIVSICRRLDGLPLAIELAAARVGVLTPQQLAERLDDRFRLLTSGARSALPRHRTLRGAVDWSYDLLSDPERVLLERLSVFAGGFTLGAVESVCADDVLLAPQVLDLLASLATRSLVAMQEEDGRARYRLLETIREYAAERRRARPEHAELAERHAQYYRELVQRAEPEVMLGRTWQMREVDLEHDNLRAALAWSAANRQGTVAGLPTMWALLWYWLHRQYFREALTQARLALTTADDPPPELRAAALHGIGLFEMYCDQVGVEEALAEARALWKQVGNDRWCGFTTLVLVFWTSLRGDVASARRLADELLELAQRLPDPWDAALAKVHAVVPLLIRQGQLDDASLLLDEAMEVYRARNYVIGIAHTLDAQAFLAFRLGDANRAVQLAAESLRQERHLEKRWLAGRSLQVLGAVAAERGETERAARLFGAAEGMYEVIGASSLTPERQAVNEVPARLRDVMPAEAFESAWESGRSMPFRAAIAFALEGDPDAPPATRASATAVAASGGAVAPDARRALVTEPVDGHDLAGAPALDVRALGRVEIRRDGVMLDDVAWAYARPRELLLYLLAHPDGRTREQIGLDFWPEISAAQVKNNFHVTLHHLRKALGGNEWVRYERGRYRVAGGSVRYDAAEFEDGARKALRKLRARPDSAPAAAWLASVLAAYGGDYLEEEGAGEWHLAVRDRLSRLLEDGLMELGQYYSVEGRQGEAAECFRRLLEHDPVHEEAARYLMLTLSRDGRRTEALRVYERLQEELQSGLGAAPAERVREVAEAVRAGARV